jgi:hypothetical protein
VHLLRSAYIHDVASCHKAKVEANEAIGLLKPITEAPGDGEPAPFTKFNKQLLREAETVSEPTLQPSNTPMSWKSYWWQALEIAELLAQIHSQVGSHNSQYHGGYGTKVSPQLGDRGRARVKTQANHLIALKKETMDEMQRPHEDQSRKRRRQDSPERTPEQETNLKEEN